MLAYRARLAAVPTAVISVAVRTLRPAAGRGLGMGRGAALCAIILRYAAADGRIYRHRSRLWAELRAPDRLRVAGYQIDGAEVLISLRPVAGAVPPAGRSTRSDSFRLPIGLQAWGVTQVTAVTATLRLICRPREGELLVRGRLRITLESPSGVFHQAVPFLRVLAADVPAGLRWVAVGRLSDLHLAVSPGGQITGAVRIDFTCQGWAPPAPAPPQARAPFAAIREAEAEVVEVAVEPAGPGHAVVRGVVGLDLYGIDSEGASRWAGRRLPFSALLNLPEGDRLEGFARIERLTHTAEQVTVALEAGATALRTETIYRGHLPYRAERVLGTAATTLVLTEALHPAPPADVGRRGHLARSAVARRRWSVSGAVLGEAPPASGREAHIPASMPIRAVMALSVAPDGALAAIVKGTGRPVLVQGQVAPAAGPLRAAIAYPVLRGDRWTVCVQIEEEKNPARQ